MLKYKYYLIIDRIIKKYEKCIKTNLLKENSKDNLKTHEIIFYTHNDESLYTSIKIWSSLDRAINNEGTYIVTFRT